MDTTIAQTILAQLGGQSRLRLMVGASNFDLGVSSLSFRLKSAQKNIKGITVTLDPSDTYTVSFHKVRGADITSKEVSDVYADSLKRVIESETGLYLSL